MEPGEHVRVDWFHEFQYMRRAAGPFTRPRGPLAPVKSWSAARLRMGGKVYTDLMSVV